MEIDEIDEIEGIDTIPTCPTCPTYSITADQLRATCRIFVEHGFLRSENTLLTERISLMERSGRARDCIIQSQQTQIGTLHSIIIKKDAIIMNGEASMDNLKAQMKAAQKKHLLIGTGIGAAVAGVLVMILK
jgi:hypothetical protein